MRGLLLVLLGAGCGSDTMDADGDGAAIEADCDDADATVHPAATESCNGRDDDCDGAIDAADSAFEGSRTAWLDRDADGYGDTDWPVQVCTVPAGYAEVDGDCDDTDATAFPGSVEVCGGGDEDCDGQIDDADPDVTGTSTWYADADGDGAGNAALATSGAAATGDDCDDADPAIGPDVTEICNGVDDDCDGQIDDADPGVAGTTMWYVDADADGFGGAELSACAVPAGVASVGGDCDDADPSAYPGAYERCGGSDEDCDGRTDLDAIDAPTWYVDTDADGWGTTAVTLVDCVQPDGFAAQPGDCDDGDADLCPDATERCDGIDQDCDGTTDEDASDAQTWYADADGDGAGDATSSQAACTAPAGWIADASDCDDADADVHPDATETCDDGVDQDCDGHERPCPLGDTVNLATAADTWLGETMDDRAGHSVAFAGDTDGDGLSEIALGAYREDSAAARAGAVYIVTATGVGEAILSAADAKLTGELEGDHSGSSVAAAGDVNADGYDDLLVGGYLAAPSYAGIAYVVYGPLASKSLGASDAILGGEADGDAAGTSVAGAGDVDGDGYDDILVGAADSAASYDGAGSAYLLYGPVSGALSLGTADVCMRGTATNAAAGTSLAGRGDIDADGLSDILVGAPEVEGGGAAYVLYGPVPTGDASLDALYDARALGPTVGDQLGYAVDILGDVDGDGYDDVGLGAPHAADNGTLAGATWLLRGPVYGELDSSDATAILLGEAPGDLSGYAVSGGDVDGDGRADIVIGAWAEDELGITAGAAYVQLGPFTGTASLGDAYAKLAGSGGSTETGHGVAAHGDLDGDGRDDLAISAPDLSTYTNGSGGMFVLLSSVFDLL